jgi:hypothetical protein
MRALFLSLFIFLLAVPARASSDEDIVFIVNAANATIEVTKEDIVDFFFKRKRTWPDGGRVRFIDMKDGSSDKQVLLKNYLGKTARELDLFWISEKNFNGQGAPIQAPSE